MKVITMKEFASLAAYLMDKVRVDLSTMTTVGCNGDFNHTEAWIEENKMSNDIVEVFNIDGARCDCGVLLYSMDRYEKMFGKDELNRLIKREQDKIYGPETNYT